MPARSRAADPQILILDRSCGKDFKLLTASRRNRKYANGLTTAGTGTILPIRTFDPVALHAGSLRRSAVRYAA
jgi:hypothetical protein